MTLQTHQKVRALDTSTLESFANGEFKQICVKHKNVRRRHLIGILRNGQQVKVTEKFCKDCGVAVSLDR